MVYGLIGYARSKIAVANFQHRVANTSLVNPLDSTFERRRINIAALCPPVGGIIEDKTFVGCDLVGPANVLFLNCNFDRNSGNVVDALCIKTGVKPTNGFAFTGCSFTRCRFYLVTFMVPEEFWDSFTRYNWTGLNWITDVPQPNIPNLLPAANAPAPSLTANP